MGLNPGIHHAPVEIRLQTMSALSAFLREPAADETTANYDQVCG